MEYTLLSGLWWNDLKQQILVLCVVQKSAISGRFCEYGIVWYILLVVSVVLSNSLIHCRKFCNNLTREYESKQRLFCLYRRVTGPRSPGLYRTNHDDPSYCLSIIFYPYFCLDSQFQWQKFTDMNEQLLCRVWRHICTVDMVYLLIKNGQLFWSELWHAQEFSTTNFTASWFGTYFAVHSKYANLRFMATVMMLDVCEVCTYSESDIPYHKVAILLWLEQCCYSKLIIHLPRMERILTSKTDRV